MLGMATPLLLVPGAVEVQKSKKQVRQQLQAYKSDTDQQKARCQSVFSLILALGGVAFLLANNFWLALLGAGLGLVASVMGVEVRRRQRAMNKGNNPGPTLASFTPIIGGLAALAGLMVALLLALGD